MRKAAWTGLARPPPRMLSLRVAHTSCKTYHESRRTKGNGSTRGFASSVEHSPEPSQHPLPEIVPSPVLRPPESKRYDPDAWVSILEPFLPDYLRAPSIPAAPPADIVSVLVDARKWGSVDLISHLWFAKSLKSDNAASSPYRRDAAEWLLSILHDAAVLPKARTTMADILAPPKPGSSLTLDEATRSKADKGQALKFLQRSIPLRPSFERSLQQLTGSKQELQDSKSYRLLGEVWYRLGAIIRRAIDSSSDAVRSEAVLIAARALSKMHHSTRTSKQHLQQGQIDNSAGLSNSKDSRKQMEAIVPALDGRRLSPSQELTAIFEFVLWECIRGGWIREAGLLLVPRRDLRRGSKQRSQHHSIQASRLAANDLVQTSNSGQDTAVLSTERPPLGDAVVLAVIDGLLASTSALGTTAQTSAEDVMGDILRLKRLKAHLEANRLSLGTASWDSIVARLLEHSTTTDGLNPRIMTSVLDMAGSYGTEGLALNTVGRDKQMATSNYAFDASAVTIGLYHQTLEAHIRARDVRGAMDTLTQLQSFTDTNKQRSMNEFLATLGDTESLKHPNGLTKGRDLSEQSLDIQHQGGTFGGIEYPAYFPSIPPALLAGLLNLTTDADMEEVGQWMVHSDEVDGPLIPPRLYSHPGLAAALIRHAAHANDTELLGEVTRAQHNDLTGETLVALCYSFAVKANWKSALRVISLSKQYSLHTWTVTDVALIAKALLGHIQSPLQPKSVTGAEFMLQKLLRGDLFLGLGPQGEEMEALAEIVSSIDGNMASLCENMLRPGGLSRFELPLECFNTLLEGIARAYGSLRAQDLYVQWCTPGQRELSRLPAQVRVDTAGTKQSISELFSQAPQKARYDTEGQQGIDSVAPAILKPNLATIRIVIDQALIESRSHGNDYVADTVDEGLPAVKASFTELETMEWAAEVLRTDFGMGEADVDYELQGYLSAQQPEGGGRKDIEPLYREQTLLMWRALAGSRLAWAQEAEERVRLFAGSTMEQQMQSEPVGAAERYFLHCLAEEFGFSAETIGEEGAERVVSLTKGLATWQKLKYPVPTTRVGDVATRYFAL